MQRLFPLEDDIIPTNRDPSATEMEDEPHSASIEQSTMRREITAELSADDLLILKMKRQGASSQDIVKRLTKKGFKEIQPNSVRPRYERICKKIQDCNDELLDEDLTDWHDGEDDILRQAHARADKQIAAEIQALREQLFTYTSQELNNLADRPRFSAKACQDRLEALSNGTARQPPELDEDPEARARDITRRKAEYFANKKTEAERLAKEAEHIKNNTPAALAKAAKKAAAEQKKVEAAAKKAAVQAEKDERDRAQEVIRQRREKVKQDHRAEERAKFSESVHDRKVLRILQKNYEDKILDDEAMEAQMRAAERRRAIQPTFSSTMRPPSRPALIYEDDRQGSHAADSPYDDPRGIQDNGSTYDEGNSYQDDAAHDAAYHRSQFADPNTPAAHRTSFSHAEHSPAEAMRSDSRQPTPHEHQYDRQPTLSLPHYYNSPPAPTTTALPSRPQIHLTDDPSLDPREIMAKPELMNLVIERGMSKNREKETKGLLARRLRESDRAASAGELHRWLKRRGLSTKGNKAELIWRLQEYDARTSRSWRPKHMAILKKSRDAVKGGFGRERTQTVGGGVQLPRPGRYEEMQGGGVRIGGMVEDGVRESVEGGYGRRESFDDGMGVEEGYDRDDGFGVRGYAGGEDGRGEEDQGRYAGREEDDDLFVGAEEENRGQLDTSYGADEEL
ncbi:SAP domain-containing protein 1 [Elsinoe australis]|uniref:SAP domain-containing protein 1 n=1 Tax=Elsinoe australis TaxID=40998 RepID=A0A4U7B4J0_9PEZI|nr:SAP domain-containing protein 1 [Elsinoe australis]